MAPSPSDGCDPLGLALRQDPEAVLESPQLSGLKVFGWSPAPYCAHFWKRRSSKRSPLSIQDLKIFDLSFEFPSKGSIPEVFLWQTAKFLQWPLGNRSQDVFFLASGSGAGCFTKLTLELSYDVTPPESQDMKVKGWGVRGWSVVFYQLCLKGADWTIYIYIYMLYIYICYIYIYVIYIYVIYLQCMESQRGPLW